MNHKTVYYAQLDTDNVCRGVSQLSGDVEGNVILLDEYDTSIINKKYNNGAWEDVDIPEESTESVNDLPIESIETILMNNQNAIMVAIAEQYEKQEVDNLAAMEAQATIYEEILAIKSQLGGNK